jgi:hypothetical protein
MENFEANENKYKEMSKPFTDIKAAQKSVKAFYEGVRKLREKHKIAEAVVLTQIYVEKDGEVYGIEGHSTHGNLFVNIQMLAKSSWSINMELIGDLTQRVQGKEVENSPLKETE